MTAAERLVALLRSLDRICPACLAATDQVTWDALHKNKDKPCQTTR